MLYEVITAADGRTGDGCGLLMQKPDGFLRKVARECGAGDLSELYGVGALMFSPNPERESRARKILTRSLTDQGLEVAGWRRIPTNPDGLGPIALASLPLFAQVFINSQDLSREELRAKLLIARRLAEKELCDDPDFYVASLSEGVVVYKGLMMPADSYNFV